MSWNKPTVKAQDDHFQKISWLLSPQSLASQERLCKISCISSVSRKMPPDEMSPIFQDSGEKKTEPNSSVPMQGQMAVSGTDGEDINRLCATVTECSAAGVCVWREGGLEACRTKVMSRSEPELGRGEPRPHERAFHCAPRKDKGTAVQWPGKWKNP